LISTIQDKQKENFTIEDDVLQRLTLLKSLNSDIEVVYKKQQVNLGEMQHKLVTIEDNHSAIIDNDEEKIR